MPLAPSALPSPPSASPMPPSPPTTSAEIQRFQPNSMFTEKRRVDGFDSVQKIHIPTVDPFIAVHRETEGRRLYYEMLRSTTPRSLLFPSPKVSFLITTNTIKIHLHSHFHQSTMEYRTLDLTLVSAKGIKKASLIGKPDVYAAVYISGAASNQKLRTQVDKDGGSNPTWNFPLNFTVDEAAGLQNRLTLVVEIKAVGTFRDKNLGEVRVPIKELLEGVSNEGKTQQVVSYQVRTKSGKTKGFLSFSYKFGAKFSGKAEEPVTAYPPGMAVGSSSAYAQPYGAAAAGGYYQPLATGYPPQPQTGYAYQHQQQSGYGGYPPPPPPGYGGYPPQQGYGNPAVQQPPKKGKFGGMGLGAGLLGGALGGLLIGDIVSDAANGGGCGDGGGCGGGCGGF